MMPAGKLCRLARDTAWRLEDFGVVSGTPGCDGRRGEENRRAAAPNFTNFTRWVTEVVKKDDEVERFEAAARSPAVAATALPGARGTLLRDALLLAGTLGAVAVLVIRRSGPQREEAAALRVMAPEEAVPIAVDEAVEEDNRPSPQASSAFE
jgi:hypothetical protein